MAALSDTNAVPAGSILTDCHPSSIMTNFGAVPPFSKLEKKIQKYIMEFQYDSHMVSIVSAEVYEIGKTPL